MIQQNYSKIIEALTADYLNVFAAEPENNYGEIVKLNGWAMDSLKSGPQEFNYTDTITDYAEKRVIPEDRAHFLELVLPDAVVKTFSDGRDRYEVSFRIFDENNVLHDYVITFIRVSKPGETLQVVVGFRNIDATVSARREQLEKGLNSAYAAISQIYMAMARVNVKNNTYYMIKSTAGIDQFSDSNSNVFSENMQRIIKALATEDSLQNALDFLDITTLEDRMADKAHLSTNFTGKVAGTCKLHFLKENDDAEGRLEHVIFAMEISDEEKFHSAFDALARNFQNIYWVNTEDDTARIMKLEGYVVQGIDSSNRQFFPYTKILSQYINDRVHPDDKEALFNAICVEHLREIFAEQDEYVGTYRTLVDGEVHNFQWNVVKMEGFQYLVMGFQNIDEIIEESLAEERRRREVEERYQRQLIAAKEEADRANAAKTDFLLRMSHDIRTPLNGIMGMLEIADNFPDDLEKQTECRVKMKNSAKVLLELINEVLDMSKLESGEIVLEHRPFMLTDIAADVWYATVKQAEERGIELIEEECKDPGHLLIGSPAHFKRLVMNILSNAIKYNKDNGKIFISLHELSCENGVAMIQFKCRDTGIGMSPEFQKRLFEPFAQEEITPRSQYVGTGLGMPIAKSITEKMGGTITFESEQGVGTTFDVRIPFEVDESAAPVHVEDHAGDAASIAGLNILLVEDNDLNLEIAQFILEQEGANVTSVCNGKEAVDAFAAAAPGAFDAVLMDVMMPVMDGYAATRAIRALDRPDAATTPIIAMTANAFAEDRIAAKEAGMDDHIAKPIDVELVVETIAKLTK